MISIHPGFRNPLKPYNFLWEIGIRFGIRWHISTDIRFPSIVFLANPVNDKTLDYLDHQSNYDKYNDQIIL